MSDDVTAVAPLDDDDVTTVSQRDGAGDARPGLVETARAGAPKLPLSDDERTDLANDLKAFCTDWAERLTGQKLDPQTATELEARDWLLAVVTVTEAVRELVSDQQHHVIRVAKKLGANNGHLAKATGLGVAGARKRALAKAPKETRGRA